jgi:hypothetical protein
MRYCSAQYWGSTRGTQIFRGVVGPQSYITRGVGGLRAQKIPRFAYERRGQMVDDNLVYVNPYGIGAAGKTNRQPYGCKSIPSHFL